MKLDRIDREVRRVRALAEGRLVRSVSWGMRRGKASAKKWRAARGLALRSPEEAHAAARTYGVIPMRITHVRRPK